MNNEPESTPLDKALEEEAEFPAVTIIRRDLLGHECLLCELGTYRESHRAEEVWCDECEHRTNRWASKRDRMVITARHIAEVLEGE